MRLASLALLIALAPVAFAKDAPVISWKKTVLDKKFRSEGCAILDVNKDGKMDVAVGEYWYEAPDWKKHEMQKPGRDYGDGLGGYSEVFACWAEDLNADGFQDLIVVGFPGAPAYWLENPKGKGTVEEKPTHWAKHEIWHSACNETPLYQDLLGDGKKVLVMGYQPKGKKPDGNEGSMAYLTPDPKDPNATWTAHPISDPAMKGAAAGTNRFSHGLGLGDINGDKKLDVITGGGWYEQLYVGDGKTHPWKFHKAEFTDSYSDMYTFDADGDGVADVLGTSAHKYGIWWYKQRPGKDGGEAGFEKKEIFKDLLSETHAAHFQDIDGDGQKDLITGKRWWSHGKGEPGSDKPAMIYWFKVTKEKDGLAKFTPMPIDEDSGIGTQFVVQDMNGDGFLDVIVSNKKGVSVILQERK